MSSKNIIKVYDNIVNCAKEYCRPNNYIVATNYKLKLETDQCLKNLSKKNINKKQRTKKLNSCSKIKKQYDTNYNKLISCAKKKCKTETKLLEQKMDELYKKKLKLETELNNVNDEYSKIFKHINKLDDNLNKVNKKLYKKYYGNKKQ